MSVGVAVRGWAGQLMMEGLCRNVRFEVRGLEHYLSVRRGGRSSLLVCWHGFLLPAVFRHRRDGLTVLVSEHGDGEILSAVMHRYAYVTIRGSSSSGGGRALRTMVRLARSERHLALSPDGPRGPRGRFKAGALLVARETGAVVVPMAVGASAGWHLRSWDGFLVPRPGSRVTVEYLEPVHVPADARRADLERMAREIETRINERTDVLGRTGWTPAEVRA